jgi:hypothetical protein
LGGNEINGATTQNILDALEINQNLIMIWTQRKHFLTFLSQLSTLSPLHVNVVMLRMDVVNVRRVLELEEMKREISFFL